MENVRIYTSEPVIKRPRKMIVDMWSDLLLSRELGWRLAVRDIRALYRQSYLGILWAIIVPFCNALVWIILRGTGVVSVGETGIPYTIYVFSGTMLWAVFAESVQAPLQKTLAAKGILSKINFPREAIIISAMLQSLFNAAIKLLLILVVAFFLGVPMGWSLLAFPLGVIMLIMAGTSVGLMVTPMGMLYTDIGRGLTVAIQFLMYATPVVYPIPKEGWISLVMSYNPMTPLVMTTRDWLAGSRPDFLNGFLLVGSAFCIALFFALAVFRVAVPRLIERMSS